jgi:aminopeptidase N
MSSLHKNMSIIVMLFIAFSAVQIKGQTASFDVTNYDAEIAPDFESKSVSGKVVVSFRSLSNNLKEITLNAGVLEIDRVGIGLNVLPFEKKDGLLRIQISRPLKKNEKLKIEIAYHGTPKYGIQFFPEQSQIYTVFSTSQWMPCVDSPDDRASFRLALDFRRDDLTVVGNGRLAEKNKPQVFVWEQRNPVPTYLFGFAAGNFREVTELHKNTTFRYLAPSQFSEVEIKKIFRETADMLDFYEEKAGVKYPSKIYTQVLAAGNAQQEMAGFSALNEEYGCGVLENEKKIWLGAHEFAHQWWGNSVTNRAWTHFWLNEGIANFMTAAYLEHRFGRAEYTSEIERYKQSYEKVRDAGKDKPLVFPDWNKPTREDRRLVYDKGAYVTHLLREELGEKLFWKGFREYTRKYFGKSVETKDFQASMEKSSGKDLSAFFNKWIYLMAK